MSEEPKAGSSRKVVWLAVLFIAVICGAGVFIFLRHTNTPAPALTEAESSPDPLTRAAKSVPRDPEQAKKDVYVPKKMPQVLVQAEKPPLDSEYHTFIRSTPHGGRIVVMDEINWKLLWKDHAKGYPVPPVDFKQNAVAVVLADIYKDILIAAVHEESTWIQVEYRLSARQKKAAPNRSKPHYLDFKILPKSGKGIIFKEI
ncbi:MAG: hypothetical protein A2901_05230 [Elusimicrobia bacterium RIFCSPLOWO2_01_FULL_54_10]|nr:MAG: hypothetical protein A2901_05230 [Elusimicrobia bacterium RIFCSPLOWO2_01_FULL_54_10]